MLARLGHVFYWTGCLLAALSLTVGWFSYPGVDTTGIEIARQRGLSDASIVQQRIAAEPASAQQYETASKAGYSPTEILDFLVKTHRSRLGGLPDLQTNPMLVITAAVALLAWLVGFALRYVLTGR
jgi:hypothetical protein